MGATKLTCKECGADYAPRGPLRLRALLRAARGRLRARASPDVDATRAGASRAARRTSGATTTSCRSSGPQPAHAHRPARRLHAADPRRPARRAPGPARGVGQERRRQPDALLQGPRRLGRHRARPRARLRHARLRLDRQPRQLRRRPRRRAGHGLLRLHPGRPRGAEDPRHRRSTARTSSRSTATTTTSTGSAPSSRGERELGLRQHQHAPVLRRGLQDPRLRDRRAARLGDAGPRRRADRLRLAVHEDRQGLRGVARARPGRGRAADDERRPGDGLLAGRHGVRRRQRRLPPGQPEHDRQVAGHRQPGRRPLRARARARAAAASIDCGHRRRDPRRHPPAGRDDGHLHRDRRRRDDRGAGQARRARRHRPRRARRARHHRRGPEDARRGPRHVRGRTRSSRPSTSSRPSSRARRCASDGRHGQAPDPAARGRAAARAR